MFFGDSVPIVPRTHWLAWILTWLVNLGVFLVIAGAVFYIAGEFDRFKSPRNLVPYAAITVSLGLVVDEAFLLLANALMPSYELHHTFYGFLRSGGYAVYQEFHGFRFLLIPSLFTFVLLGLVQAVLIGRLLHNRIDTAKVIVMSAIVAFVTLPTWAVIYLLSRPPRPSW
ncbi:MAG TPA: hypothetical protein VIK22_08655 [Candidatus Anoxymicrobiaceae bacterium]